MLAVTGAILFMNVLDHSGISSSFSIHPAFCLHISCDLGFDLEEKLLTEMVMTYCSARTPNYILGYSVCVWVRHQCDLVSLLVECHIKIC